MGARGGSHGPRGDLPARDAPWQSASRASAGTRPRHAEHKGHGPGSDFKPNCSTLFCSLSLGVPGRPARAASRRKSAVRAEHEILQREPPPDGPCLIVTRGSLAGFMRPVKPPHRCLLFQENREFDSPSVRAGWAWEPSFLTGFAGSRASRGHLIVEPVCWQEALPRPAGSQHDNETVSMEMSL